MVVTVELAHLEARAPLDLGGKMQKMDLEDGLLLGGVNQAEVMAAPVEKVFQVELAVPVDPAVRAVTLK